MKDLSRRFKNGFREGKASRFCGVHALAQLLACQELKGSCAPTMGGLRICSCTEV